MVIPKENRPGHTHRPDSRSTSPHPRQQRALVANASWEPATVVMRNQNSDTVLEVPAAVAPTFPHSPAGVDGNTTTRGGQPPPPQMEVWVRFRCLQRPGGGALLFGPYVRVFFVDFFQKSI